MVDPISMSETPWGSNKEVALCYIPMQAKAGDYALFLRKAAVEFQFEGENFLIIPQGAILVLLRDEDELEDDMH